MAATHLVTFTRRELLEAEFWTVDQWAAAWDRMRRALERWRPGFLYVAVLERHKKGNFHLHVAWVEAPGEKVNLNVVRGLWWGVCGGRGRGNVDAQYIKVRAGLERADKVARYISKYTAKHFEEDARFNKKRYWASRQTLEDARRYILGQCTVDEALRRVLAMHGLDMGNYVQYQGKRGPRYDGFFPFPDGSGFWMACIPDKHAAPIPF
jgi:hypothetical protein